MITYKVIFDILQKEIDRLEKQWEEQYWDDKKDKIIDRVIDIRCKYALLRVLVDIKFAIENIGMKKFF